MCQFCVSQNVSNGFSRRGFVKTLGMAAAGLTVAGQALAEPAKAPPKPQNVVSPDEALSLLTAGNARYVAGTMKLHDFKNEREPLTLGQNPYAAILSCADSRIAPEYAFDAARGDLFVCRVAGNFANDDVIASLEFGVAVLKTPLIMVLGHDACGAVDATIESLKTNETLPGHLPSLVAALAPAVKASEGKPGDQLANAIRENVILNVQKLKSATPIISAAVEKGQIRIVGATYRLTDGHVELVG